MQYWDRGCERAAEARINTSTISICWFKKHLVNKEIWEPPLIIERSTGSLLRRGLAPVSSSQRSRSRIFSFAGNLLTGASAEDRDQRAQMSIFIFRFVFVILAALSERLSASSKLVALPNFISENKLMHEVCCWSESIVFKRFVYGRKFYYQLQIRHLRQFFDNSCLSHWSAHTQPSLGDPPPTKRADGEE